MQEDMHYPVQSYISFTKHHSKLDILWIRVQITSLYNTTSYEYVAGEILFED